MEQVTPGGPLVAEQRGSRQHPQDLELQVPGWQMVEVKVSEQLEVGSKQLYSRVPGLERNRASRRCPKEVNLAWVKYTSFLKFYLLVYLFLNSNVINR